MNQLFLAIILALVACVSAQSELACAGVPAGQFVRNSESCQSYYFCDGKRAIPAMCPSNYLFNAKSQVCDHAVNVDCTECSKFGIQHLSDPSSCNGYLQCVNGQRSKVSCIGNLAFDVVMGDCNVQQNAESVCHDSICTEYKEHVRIGDAKDCTYYYTCFNRKAYKKSCAPGLLFNVYMGQCQRSATHEFCQDDGPTIIGYENEELSTVGPNEEDNEINAQYFSKHPLGEKSATKMMNVLSQYYKTGHVAGFNNVPKPATMKPFQQNVYQTVTAPSTTTARQLQEKHMDCLMADRSFPHPESCTKFIRCTSWHPQVIDCKTGYYWHQDRRRCAPEKPANC